MKANLINFIAEQTGGKVIKLEINDMESEVVIGSSIFFPSSFTSTKQKKLFWDGWEKEYEKQTTDKK